MGHFYSKNHRRVRICTCFYAIILSFQDKEAVTHPSQRKKKESFQTFHQGRS